MRANLAGKPTVIKNRLHNAAHKSSTVERTLVLGNRYKLIDEGLVLDNKVCLLVVISPLQLVSFLSKQRLPDRPLDEEQGVDQLVLALRTENKEGLVYWQSAGCP